MGRIGLVIGLLFTYSDGWLAGATNYAYAPRLGIGTVPRGPDNRLEISLAASNSFLRPVTD